jgi:hypothetical protein
LLALSSQIAILREYHRKLLVHENEEFRPGSLTQLEGRWLFSEVELQSLWLRFMKPCPWHVLLHASIPSFTWLQQSFVPVVFPKCSQEWRDHGLISGLMERLFAVLDTNGSYKVDFGEFLAGVHLLCKGTEDDKLSFAFRFCDQNEDGLVDREELSKMVMMLEDTYNGRHRSLHNANLFCDVVFSSEKQNLDHKLQYDDFCHYVLMHPLICKFFKLDSEPSPSLLQP